MSTNHPRNRLLARTGVTLAAIGVFVLAGAGIASAHVTAHSPDQLVQGGDAEIVFRSPNEEPTAAMVKLQVNFSLTSPIGDADIKPMPGWNYQVTMTTLPTPVRMSDDSISSAVQSITWTAQPGFGIKPGEFQEFDISIEGLPTNTTTMDMPAVQTYDDGDVVNWNQPTPASGVEPDHPLPHLTLAAANATDDAAADSGSPAVVDGMAGMTATGTTSASAGTDNTARWLAGIGLLLAALALGFGIGTFARSRSAGSGSAGPDDGGGDDDDDDDDLDDEAPPKDERSKQGAST